MIGQNGMKNTDRGAAVTRQKDGRQVMVSYYYYNGGDNADTTIQIDGKSYETSKMLEDGAYYTFQTSGRDSYFRNALVLVRRRALHRIAGNDCSSADDRV